MKKICSTCLRRIENDDAAVLVMGAYGTPKLLCDECSALIETITTSRDYSEITDAMKKMTEIMSEANADDRVTLATMTNILGNSAIRAQKIKEGTYDFALDEEKEDEGFDDIPEELRETEEDRLLDEKEAASNAKFDKFMNWVCIGAASAFILFLIWKLIEFVFIK